MCGYLLVISRNAKFREHHNQKMRPTHGTQRNKNQKSIKWTSSIIRTDKQANDSALIVIPLLYLQLISLLPNKRPLTHPYPILINPNVSYLHPPHPSMVISVVISVISVIPVTPVCGSLSMALLSMFVR